jgi:hypothetical protein
LALPCVCHKCARCISLESLKDPVCLSVEEQNCEDRNCNSCDFTCERFTEKTDPKKTGKGLYFFER